MEDAQLAVELGAAALGFNFYKPSPRYLTPAKAAVIIRQLPPFMTPVGIFADQPSARRVVTLARAAGVAAVQLHGPRFPSINAALDYADGLTRASLSPGVGGKAADQPRQPEKASSTPKREPQLPAHIKVAEAYRAKAFELMTANVNATLEYAQQLVNVRSLPEFIELSTTHARQHLQLIMTQAAALGALSQSLTAGNVERVTAIAKALSQKTA